MEYCQSVNKILYSPNSHLRIVKPQIIVLHKIALPLKDPSLDCVCNFFCNNELQSECEFTSSIQSQKVSSHFVVGREGLVVQCVCPLTRVAWHCGRSNYKGQSQCNEFSIGIEFIGYDWEDITSEQYSKAGVLIKSLMRDFKIELDAVVGHKDLSPARKTDPGFINKNYLLA